MMLAAVAAIGTQAFTVSDYMFSAPVAVSWATTEATKCNITTSGSSDASKNTLTTQTLTTSDISNSMSVSASSSGTSVGTNMMDGIYAMAKAVAGNLLNNGKASQSDASTTTSAISAAQVTVGGKTTDTSKDSLIDSSGQAVSTSIGLNT